MEFTTINNMSADIYTSLDVLSDKDLVKKLKAKINDWANNIPHHPHNNLGDKIKIQSLNNMPCYTASIDTQFEKRDKRYTQKPYTGGTLPQQTIFNITQVNEWDEVLKSVSEFTNTNHKYVKNGSQFITDCATCNAKGYIVCQTCGGACRWECKSCDGKGENECSSCGGKGKSECYSCRGAGTITKEERCFYCHGSGRGEEDRATGQHSLGGHCSHCRGGYNKKTETCSSCGGSGYDGCYKCEETGKTSCRKCGGKGYITCTTCGGKGRETCSTCKGAKQLVEYIQVEQTFRSNNRQSYLVDPTVSKLFPEIISDLNSWPSSHLFTVSKESISTNDAPQGTLLDDVIAKTIKNSHSGINGYEKMLFQELNIRRIDTWVLKYSFQGQIYHMLFQGSNYSIIQGESPIAEFQETIFGDAQSAIDKRSYRKARRLLEKCNDINDSRQAHKVFSSLEQVEGKLEAAYRFGDNLAYRTIFIIIGFISFAYYNDTNYVFHWFDFINDPSNFLHDIHPWAMALFTSLCILTFTRETEDKAIKWFGYSPNAPMRFALGFLTNAIYALLITIIIFLINLTGLSFILSFIGVVVIWIIKIVGGLIVLIYEILAWFFGLFF